ncbi:MAG: outer membrane protein transport protein [Myxococcales bacterium]|nr:outer membrane protein transport protein [Myxococcales bacterium]
MRAASRLVLALGLCVTTEASAGGFYLTDRGVRPLGRGGAFIAGADDQHAIWYNPAGLTEAGSGLLIDASLVNFNNVYTRQSLPDPNGQPVTFGAVTGEGAPLPIPTVVVSHNFGLRRWNFAAGLFAPYAAISSYDESPLAPQRYTLYTLNGSLLSVAGLYAAYRPHPTFSVGVGVSALAGSFASRLAFSACPATITCTAEDPDWDSVAQLTVGPIFSPTANVGLQWRPHRMLAVGVSGQLPFWVDAPARLQVRLPSSAFYNGAQVEGDRGRVNFTLAPIARVGVQVSPLPRTHVEVAFVWEGWSVHDKINLVPDNIRITRARGIGTYEIGPVALDRSFQDTFSFRLGAEHETVFSDDLSVSARVGAAYETSATSPAYTNVLTMDADKFVTSLGASLRYRRWRFDAAFAYMFASSVVVDPRDARLYPTAPFRQGPNAPRYTINGGSYDLSVNVIGLGARYAF